MQTRPIGSSGLETSVLAFGALTFTGGGGPHSVIGKVDLNGARRMIDICLDAGVTLFDTADIYSEGVSEEILGAALGKRRERVVLATKGFGRTGPGEHDVGLSARHLVAACEASLRRLGTDRIDLYQLHEFDGMTALDETLEAVDGLLRAGKIRAVGCSNFTGWQAMKALGIADRRDWPRLACHQLYYSLLARDAEHEMIPAAVDQNMGVLVWGPLASGYLTGKHRNAAAGGESRIAAMGDMGLFDRQEAERALDVVADIAADRGVTMSQVSINWLLRKPGVTSVIVGARDEAQLHDNLGAAAFVLSPAEVDRLDAASAPRLPYPLWHQRGPYSEGRNPAPPTYQA